MRDFEVWKSYIDALDILTNQYSEPFDIKVLEVKNDSSVVCRYIDDNQKLSKKNVFTHSYKYRMLPK